MTNDYTDHCQPIKQSTSADTLSLSVVRSKAIFQEPVNQRINQLDGHQQSVNHLVSQTVITQKSVSQSVLSHFNIILLQVWFKTASQTIIRCQLDHRSAGQSDSQAGVLWQAIALSVSLKVCHSCSSWAVKSYSVSWSLSIKYVNLQPVAIASHSVKKVTS